MIWKSWKFWAAVVAVILAIVAVVLYFVSEKFCYAVSGFLIGGLLCFGIGYVVGKKNIASKPEAKPAEEVEQKAAPKQEKKQEVRRPHW